MEKLNILNNIFDETEIIQIPVKIKTKIEDFVKAKTEEVSISKALCSTKIKNADEEINQLKESLAEAEKENKQFKQVKEELKQLQLSLESKTDENEKLKLELSVIELQRKSLQKENDLMTNEKERLSQMVDRRTNEVERLRIELRDLETKLKENLNAKCEAMAQLDSCSTKEANIDVKTKIFEQEKALLQNQVSSLRNDLERYINELADVRSETSHKLLTVNSQLFEKTEELKLAKSMNSQLEKANELLSLKAEDLSIRIKTDAEETQKLIEHYEKELQSQKKLANLYKENRDENINKNEEMTKYITELQSLLHEATDEYGVLENKLKQTESKHQEVLKEKEDLIKQLNDQISQSHTLNEEIDKLNNESAMDLISPSASINKRLKLGGLSLTELYSAYVKACNELQEQKKENEKLQLQFKYVLSEIEDNAPVLKKQIAEYNHLVETNAYLTKQIESNANSQKETQAKFTDLNTKVNFLQRENQKLKTERGDLARQVCHLLQKIEDFGNQTDSNAEVTMEMTSNEVISKNLVTFSNIEELQEQNTKLLLLVRDLSSKLEEIEENSQCENNENLNLKMITYTQKIEELRNSQEIQTEIIENCMKQRDRYKELYLESIKVRSNISNADEEMPNVRENQNDDQSLSSKIDNLNKLIAQKDQELDDIKKSFDKYKIEKNINEKLITDQLENMRQEVRELTAKNYKIASAIEFKTEQLKVNNKTVEMYKQQIASLEERNKNYEIIISRHETSLKSLTDEILKTQNKLSKAEMDGEHYKQEIQRLRELEIRYTSEKEIFQNERQTQTLLLQNLETIKANIQKSEVDGKLKLESNLSELSRECSALRRRLQEEEDRFREVFSNVESERRKFSETLNEKDHLILNLKNNLSVLEDDLKMKNNQVAELNEKHLNSISSSLKDKESESLIRKLQKKIEENSIEISSLTQQLNMAREHSKQFSHMAENAERQIRDISEEFEKKNQDMENEIKTLKQKEVTLTEKLENMERDFELQIASSRSGTNLNEKEEIENLKRELAEAITKINTIKSEAANLRSQYMQASDDLRKTEQKYANEMVLHSADIQSYAALKEEYQKILNECKNIKLSKETTDNILAKHQTILQSLENKHKAEKQDLESQLQDLRSHNSVLLDQIESLSSKIAIFTNQDDPDISFTEDKSKSSEELLRIIKYLRKEKEIAISKLELLNNESTRIKTEYKMLQKNFEKLSESAKNKPSEAQMVIGTTIKYQELLRKMDTINAITDSNRFLREERDALANRVKDLTESVNQVQNELLPLKEKDQELSLKLDSLTNENAALRIEATRWRQRATLLVERSNKSSPDDIKRLQQEKENLTKNIVAEKEECRKLTDELKQNKADRLRLEADISGLKKTNTNLLDEINKHQVEIGVFRESVAKLLSELKEVKDSHKQELEQLNLVLSDKDAQLIDTKNKEMQIRKIAKRYKDSYLELQRQQETKPETVNQEAIDNNITSKSEEIQGLIDENNSLKKQIEELKTCLEKEERNKSLLKEAKQRIMGLNETKQNYVKELQQLKTKLISLEQNKSELGDNELIVQKTKENEELSAKVNQLTRQIALQSVKPMPASTSVEKSSIESVRTANVRPITPTTQHSTSVTMWRGNETPLASIRPMTVQGGRSASIIGSNQIISVPVETAASSTHMDTVVNNQCGTSSTMVATVPPLASSNLEQPHDNNSEQYIVEDSNNFQSGSIISQTVALVSPRVEAVHGVDTSQQCPIDEDVLNNDEESESSLINMQPASSSVSVSTSQTSLKRNRETDSTCVNIVESPQAKKTRSVSNDSDIKTSNKFLNEVEYQVPTSSQRDQDDDVVEIDDEREATVDIDEKVETLQVLYSEEQNSADESSVDPSSVDNPKSMVSSAQQEGKASSSDAQIKPTSSEVWFGNIKNEADMTNEARTSMLHTTTLNTFEVSDESGNIDNDVANIDASDKKENADMEEPTDKE